MKIFTRFYLFIILFLFQVLHAEDRPKATFANLASLLTDEQKQLLPGFEGPLKMAQEGSLLFQDIISKAVADVLNMKKIQIELDQSIYATYGLELTGKFVEKHDVEKLMFIYTRLAEDLILGEHTKADPVLGFKLLIHATSYGYNWAKGILIGMLYEQHSYIGNQNTIPAFDHLIELWEQYQLGDPPVSIEMAFNEPELNDLAEPADNLFGTCPNPLGDMQKWSQLRDKLQADILSDGIVTDDEINQAYLQFTDIKLSTSDHVESFQFNRISFNFFDLQLNAMLSLLINSTESTKVNVKISDSLLDSRLLIKSKEVPGLMVLAQLMNDFDLQVHCYDDWMLFSSKNNSPQAKMHLFIGNFMVKKEVIKSKSNQVHILWQNGIEYKGGYLDGKANQQGTYLFKTQSNNIADTLLEGEFKAGVLHGAGKYKDSNDRHGNRFVSYTGQFKNGIFNGKGHYINSFDRLNHNGTFVDGEFNESGLGEYYFIRDREKESKFYHQKSPDDFIERNKKLDNVIMYKGQISEGVPHGQGHCYLQEVDYPCRFHKGNLIGIGDFLLLPK